MSLDSSKDLRMCQHLNRLNKADAIKWDVAYVEFCKTRAWNLWGGQMANKTIKVFGEVEMDMKRILENVRANLNEAEQYRISSSPAENSQSGRYYGYAMDYLNAAELLVSGGPVCFEHGRMKVLCECGCKKYLCGFCTTEADQAAKDKENSK